MSNDHTRSDDSIRISIAWMRDTRYLFAVGVAIGLMIILQLALLGHKGSVIATPDPIPLSIRQSAGFSLYYPDPTKLPAGYSLDKNSISLSQQAVLLIVTNAKQQRIIMTIQKKPSDAAIQTFYRVHMPLTLPISTDIGPAAQGDLNNETVVSLPTSADAWILATAPLNVNQQQMAQVMKSLVLAR